MKIRLSQAVCLPGMSQFKVKVTTTVSGLVVIEPKIDVAFKYQVSIANGVAEVTHNASFEVLASNFSTKERRLPKGMIVAGGTRHPLALVPIAGRFSKDIANCLHIGGSDRLNEDEDNPSVGGDDEKDANIRKYWQDSVYLSHVEDSALRAQILEMLSKYTEMWNGRLGRNDATAHRI